MSITLSNTEFIGRPGIATDKVIARTGAGLPDSYYLSGVRSSARRLYRRTEITPSLQVQTDLSTV